MKTLLALIGLIGPIIAWLIRNADKQDEEKKAVKKEIHDAVYSGDPSRISAVIMRLRK